MTEKLDVKTIDAGVLTLGYLEDGPLDGWPVVLAHGFPYDVHAFDQVVPLLTIHGARIIRPYLRGFGPTRFLSARTPRSGQQAALGSDLVRCSVPCASRPPSWPGTTGAAWPHVSPRPCGPSV